MSANLLNSINNVQTTIEEVKNVVKPSPEVIEGNVQETVGSA